MELAILSSRCSQQTFMQFSERQHRHNSHSRLICRACGKSSCKKRRFCSPTQDPYHLSFSSVVCLLVLLDHQEADTSLFTLCLRKSLVGSGIGLFGSAELSMVQVQAASRRGHKTKPGSIRLRVDKFTWLTPASSNVYLDSGLRHQRKKSNIRSPTTLAHVPT